MARITTVAARDLTLEHLFLAAAVPHTHPPRTRASDDEEVIAGQIVGYHQSPAAVVVYLSLRGEEPEHVHVDLDTPITVLNAPQPEINILGFGS